MAAAETEWTVEKLQQELLNVEKRGNFTLEALEPLWEKAREAVQSEEQVVSLYTTYIYLVRRFIQNQDSQNYARVDELFKEAIDFINEIAEEECSETSAQLQKNYAYFLYTRMRTPEPARQIWDRLLQYESGPFAWQQAVALERAYGDIEHARLLFYKALDVVTFRPHDIFAAFVQFEREEGTREQLDRALEQINARVAEFNVRAEQHQYFRQKQDRIHGKEPKPQQQLTGQKWKGKQQPQQNGREKRGAEGGGGRTKPSKDQQNELANKNVKQKQQQSRRQPVTIKNEERMMGLEEEAAEEDAAAPAGTFQTSAAPIGPMIPGMAALEVKEAEERPKIESNAKMNEGSAQKMEMDDENVEAEEEEEQKMEEEEDKGRKRRRQNSGSSSSAAFPYGTSLEKNKLFVKQLHFGCKPQELKEFFGRFGKVLDARIVTKWNGKSKGCAYVDFATDEEAGAAVMGADGAEIRGRKIAVFLSNPPQKRSRMDGASEGGEAEKDGKEGGRQSPRPEKPQQKIQPAKKVLGQGSYGLFAPRSVATTSAMKAKATRLSGFEKR